MPEIPHIENKEEYLDYLVNQGVGDATLKSYVSYLKSASRILNRPLSAELFPNLNQADFEDICLQIKQEQEYAQYSFTTRKNAIAAMQHYFNRIKENNY